MSRREHGSQSHRRSWGPWLRLGVLVVLLGVGVIVALRFPLPDRQELVSGPLVEGPWAPLVFGLVYATATLAPVPKNVLSAAAGFVFGLGPGAVLVWSAALVGSGVAFWLGRLLGRDGVERLARGHLARVDAMVDRYGGWAVLGLRLVPVVPFTALNYGSGITTLRFGRYLLATGVGIAPGTVSYVALGAYGTDPRSGPFLAAAVALLLLSASGAFLAGRHRHRSTTPPAGASPFEPRDPSGRR